MQITNVSYYEGKFKDGDGSFQIMVEDEASYTIYRLGTGGIMSSDQIIKSRIDRPEVFPEAIGKFVPELIALTKPIPVKQVPSYQEAERLLQTYFRAYAVTFS